MTYVTEEQRSWTGCIDGPNMAKILTGGARHGPHASPWATRISTSVSGLSNRNDVSDAFAQRLQLALDDVPQRIPIDLEIAKP